MSCSCLIRELELILSDLPIKYQSHLSDFHFQELKRKADSYIAQIQEMSSFPFQFANSYIESENKRCPTSTTFLILSQM